MYSQFPLILKDNIKFLTTEYRIYSALRSVLWYKKKYGILGRLNKGRPTTERGER